MKKLYELPFTVDYVRDWTYVEAVRELFQNAMDNEIMNPENTMSFGYSSEQKCLRVANKTSVLEVSSLLLGASSKRDNDDTVGKYGEGYKIALLVLLREGKEVTIYNHGKKEVWRTRLDKSKNYGEIVPVIEVDTPLWGKAPNYDLVIEVQGITEEEIEKITAKTLVMQDNVECFEGTNGRVLLAKKEAGRVYVNGLYVSTVEGITMGYDFKPNKISLDRDRRLVADFELKWAMAEMWVGLEDTEEKIEVLTQLIEDGAEDTCYVTSLDQPRSSVRVNIVKRFKETYGESAVPVRTNIELTEAKEKDLEPVIVNDVVHSILSKSEEFKEAADKGRRESAHAILCRLRSRIESRIDEEEMSMLENVIGRLKSYSL